jgi:hypothetical protein
MRILTRREWGASVSPGYARGEGISEVWMHHSVTIADDDYSFEGVNDVVKDMKEIERIGKSRFGVFPYSFCIHPSGVVGEGAGWDHKGAHTQNHNTVGLGICYIGNYDANPLPVGMRAAAIELIDYGYSIGKLPQKLEFPTGGHRDLKATACPGRHAYGEIPFQRQMTGSGMYVPQPDPAPSQPRPSGAKLTTVTVDLPVLSTSTRSSLPQDTKTLQHLLNVKASQNLVVDGDYYNATKAAVMNVQAFLGMTKDGIAGKDTWGILLAIPV